MRKVYTDPTYLDSSLSSKNYGYARWTDLVRATDYFDLETRDSNHSFFREKNLTKG